MQRGRKQHSIVVIDHRQHLERGWYLSATVVSEEGWGDVPLIKIYIYIYEKHAHTIAVREKQKMAAGNELKKRRAPVKKKFPMLPPVQSNLGLKNRTVNK